MDLILEWYRSKKLTTSAAVEFAEFVATRWWWPFSGGLLFSSALLINISAFLAFERQKSIVKRNTSIASVYILLFVAKKIRGKSVSFI